MNLYLFEDGKLSRKNNTLLFTAKKGEEIFYPIKTIKTIFVFSRIDIEASAFEILKKASTNIYFLSSDHRQIYALCNGFPAEGKYLISQVTGYLNEKRLTIAKGIVYSTCHNMIAVLKYYQRKSEEIASRIENLKKKKRIIKTIVNIDRLLLLEASLWKEYYACFSYILDMPFKRIQQNADDIINNLINFLNGVLYSTCLDQIFLARLNPSIAYLHATNERTFSLQFDISEMFKPLLVERTIFSMIHKRMFDLNGCLEIKDGKYRLKKEISKIAIIEFNHHLDSTIKIKNRFYSYRSLIFVDCIGLRSYLIGEKEKISFYKSIHR